MAPTMEECQRRLRDQVTLAQDLFSSPGSAHYQDIEWLNTVLANARTEFDACAAIAREG